MRKHLFLPTTAEDRDETASLLVGTAQEFDISTRDILVTPSGFWITERLMDLLVDEKVLSPSGERLSAKKRSTKTKTSGNRAAKTAATNKE